MAVTKIHPIKSTLKKALDYIENPAKTDEKMLVSSFACSYETADIEFELLLSQAMQKGNNLAHQQTAELQKIGVNVNQIARRLNNMGPLYTQDVADIKGALAQIWQLQRYILSSQR